jgi:hypothetical protein
MCAHQVGPSDDESGRVMLLARWIDLTREIIARVGLLCQ